MILAVGRSCRRSSSRFAFKSVAMLIVPVAFPPGRARLATRPSLTGSRPPVNTIGIVGVAVLAANAGSPPPVATITATGRRTKSAANAGRRSYCPSAQRNSIAKLCPSTAPTSFNPRRSAATIGANVASDPLLRYPITGNAGCCARAANGEAAIPPRPRRTWHRRQPKQTGRKRHGRQFFGQRAGGKADRIASGVGAQRRGYRSTRQSQVSESALGVEKRSCGGGCIWAPTRHCRSEQGERLRQSLRDAGAGAGGGAVCRGRRFFHRPPRRDRAARCSARGARDLRPKRIRRCWWTHELWNKHYRGKPPSWALHRADSKGQQTR